MRPLEGIRVVELGTHIVVPLSARVMADWGAEVIKIEAPTGDAWRTVGIFDGVPCGDGENPLYTVANTGKEMISLNLKTEKAREALYRILEDADIFTTNVRLAAIERMGLDYETLHKKFPRLIYFHFSGFGYEGPEASRPGFDSAAFFAMCGYMTDFQEKGARPMMTLGGIGDSITSNCALSGIMAALYHRERTGEGLRLTTSLYTAGMWCNFPNVVTCQDNYLPNLMPRVASENPNPLYEIYQCADGGWMMLATSEYAKFERTIKALGLDEVLGDERFSTQKKMQENQRILFDMISARFKQFTSDEWAVRLQEADLIYQKLTPANEVTKSEQAWANGYLDRVKMADGREAIVPTSPIKFYGWERPEITRHHNLGQDTSIVLERYGYAPEEIKEMKAQGIVKGE